MLQLSGKAATKPGCVSNTTQQRAHLEPGTVRFVITDRAGEQLATIQRDDKKVIENQDQDNFLERLGPGLITGASDDDPSGIGTYSQAGAQLGFGVGWTMLVT